MALFLVSQSICYVYGGLTRKATFSSQCRFFLIWMNQSGLSPLAHEFRSDMSAPMAEISEVIGLSVEDGCFSLEIKLEIKAKQILP